METKTKSKFNQLCVWQGVIEPDSAKELEDYIEQQFNGVRIKYAETVITMPDLKDGEVVKETGGRSDVFFYVHSDDISKFAVPRLMAGIRWWEDVLSNGGGKLYPDSILTKYPKNW